VAKGKLLDLPSPSDSEIRRRLMAVLDKQPWASMHSTSVFVSNGVVELWGFLESPKEKEATRVAAEEIAGVKQVVDHRTAQTAVNAAL